MTVHRLHLALFALALHAAAQTPPAASPSAPKSTLNHALVFVDAAHGGDDAGARLSDHLLEKDVTLRLANRLRSQLSSFGLNVVMTREGDAPANPPPTPSPGSVAPAPSTDARAGQANHLHPFACLVLHATSTGSGVHLVTSALPETAASTDGPPLSLVPWERAQGSFVAQSGQLAAELSMALARGGLTVHTSHASIRPLDNLTCPAVLVELAPLAGSSVCDAGYQARVAQALATALLFWRGHAEPAQSGSDSPTGAGAPQP